MVCKLLKNRYNEQIAFDADCLALLCRSRGEQRAREIVEEVVFHLTDRMGLLGRAIAAGDVAQAQALAGRLAAMSAQVGLIGFSRVARDLGCCLGVRDEAAVAAVSARLERLADKAIRQILDHADRTAL